MDRDSVCAAPQKFLFVDHLIQQDLRLCAVHRVDHIACQPIDGHGALMEQEKQLRDHVVFGLEGFALRVVNDRFDLAGDMLSLQDASQFPRIQFKEAAEKRQRQRRIKEFERRNHAVHIRVRGNAQMRLQKSFPLVPVQHDALRFGDIGKQFKKGAVDQFRQADVPAVVVPHDARDELRRLFLRQVRGKHRRAGFEDALPTRRVLRHRNPDIFFSLQLRAAVVLPARQIEHICVVEPALQAILGHIGKDREAVAPLRQEQANASAAGPGALQSRQRLPPVVRVLQTQQDWNLLRHSVCQGAIKRGCVGFGEHMRLECGQGHPHCHAAGLRPSDRLPQHETALSLAAVARNDDRAARELLQFFTCRRVRHVTVCADDREHGWKAVVDAVIIPHILPGAGRPRLRHRPNGDELDLGETAHVLQLGVQRFPNLSDDAVQPGQGPEDADDFVLFQCIGEPVQPGGKLRNCHPLSQKEFQHLLRFFLACLCETGKSGDAGHGIRLHTVGPKVQNGLFVRNADAVLTGMNRSVFTIRFIGFLRPLPHDVRKGRRFHIIPERKNRTADFWNGGPAQRQIGCG